VTIEGSGRVLQWLAAAAVDAPDAIAAARRALDRGAAVVTTPRGAVICFATEGPRPRRLVEFDPGGAMLAALAWDGEALACARVRLPDRSWITIEPRATDAAPWGTSDRLRHDGGAATLAEALDWTDVDRIPTVLEPARLPRGAGSAVLNLIAALAADQQRASLRYRGPYPTEQLFLALLESFRYAPAHDDPLAAFGAGALAWHPAPHERRFAGPDVLVQERDRVEKIVWRGRTYYREDWQGVRRRAPRRVVEREGGVSAVLWALGAPLEEHLRLPADGPPVVVPAPCIGEAPRRPLPAAVAEGALSIVAATGTPALAPFVRAAGAALTLAWAPLGGELLVWRGHRAEVSSRVRDRLIALLSTAPDRSARAGLALTALAELAALAADGLRARAQATLASLPPAEQAAALASETPASTTADASRIAAAVEALMLEVADPGR
jgi:hypothetical protein